MNAQAPAQSHTLSLSSDLLTGTEWSAAHVQELFRLAADVKAHPDRYKTALAGRFLAMIFEKPSLRTRVTFEVGIASMGGTAVYLDHADTHLGDRESIPDVGRCLSRWVHGIVARVFSQEALEVLAAYASVPVINALSDVYHPCQTLCDFFTIEEKFGSARGLKLAYVGDGNNVCHSLMVAGARVGRARAHRDAGGLRAGREYRRGGAARCRCDAGHDRIVSRSRRSRLGRAGCLHRRLGQHGPGKRSRSARRNFCAVSGERQTDVPGRARRRFSSLSSRASRLRSDR